VDVVESCHGFLWLLLRTPDLPSSEGGVLCGDDGLLVEKMNSVDPFFFKNSRIFLFFFRTVGFFLLDQTGSRV
jgi:hypothetical protein